MVQAFCLTSLLSPLKSQTNLLNCIVRHIVILLHQCVHAHIWAIVRKIALNYSIRSVSPHCSTLPAAVAPVQDLLYLMYYTSSALSALAVTALCANK